MGTEIHLTELRKKAESEGNKEMLLERIYKTSIAVLISLQYTSGTNISNATSILKANAELLNALKEERK